MSVHVPRMLGASVLSVALGLGAAACGGDEPAPAASEPSATEHNDVDVAFASEMLQHHAQALSMVDLSVERSLDPEVVELAEQVRAAQGPEIETFSDWLTEWGEEVPQTMRDHGNAGHDMGDMGESMEGMDTSMPGMMSAEQMTELEEASDDEFQTLWLEMMVDHHTGAVEMAEAHIEDGQFMPAIDLARDIAEGQSSEIEAIGELLDGS